MTSKCISCGSPLVSGQRFCTVCGAKNETPSQTVKGGLSESVSPTKDDSAEIEALKFELNEVKRTLQLSKTEASEYKRLYEEETQKLKEATDRGKHLEQQLSASKTELQQKLDELSKTQNRVAEAAFPNTLIETIKEFLGEDGEIDQKEIDLIYTEARAFGISDERTKSWLVVESERVKRAHFKKTPIDKKPRKRIWKRLIVIIIILVLLLALALAAFVFQENVLDTLDSWGLQTKALRNWLEQIS